MNKDHLSQADKFALLPKADRDVILESMSAEQIKELYHDWRWWARPKQLRCFEDDWNVFFYLAARAFGKSATGCQWVVHKARTNPGCNIAVVGATAGIVNRTVVHGPGGIMEIVRNGEAVHKRGDAIIKFENGSVINLYSAAEPSRLRGPNHHFALADDLVAWKYEEAYHMLKLTVRIGANPQLLITSSPAATPLILNIISRGSEDELEIEQAVDEVNENEFVKKDNLIIVRGTTFENTHLPNVILEEYKKAYPEHTVMGQQELHGKIVLKVDGALWDRKWIQHFQAVDSEGNIRKPTDYARTIVAVDPAVSVNKNSDYTAIVVASKGADGNFYVRHAERGKWTGGEWAEKVMSVYHKYNADKILAEKNNGGLLVQETLQNQTFFYLEDSRGEKIKHQVDGKLIPIELIHAKEGKYVRATPVAFLYETSKVWHVGTFPELEQQMISFKGEPNGSDDLVDAMVYTLLELSGARIGEPQLPVVGGSRQIERLSFL